MKKDYNFYNNELLKRDDHFYGSSKFSFEGWNKSYPFKLMFKVFENEVYKTPFSKDLPSVEFVLPIPPQELSIQMNFANILQPTLGGIVEQSNGAPFREIILNGTTGVNLVKNTAHSIGQLALSLQGGSLTGGTLNEGQNIFFNVNNIANSSGVKPDGKGIVNNAYGTNRADETSVYYKATGFYQIEALKSFLEKYAELKRQDKQYDSFNSSNLRLIFANYKDQSFYVVSGVSFAIKRSANDPLVYNYNIVMRAYRRIEPEQIESSISTEKIRFRPDYYAQATFKVNSAIELLENTNRGIAALVGDTSNQIKRAAKSASMFLKNLGGLVFTLQDLPESIQKNIIDQAAKTPGRLGNQFNSLLNKVTAAKGSNSNIGTNSSALRSDQSGITGLKEVIDPNTPLRNFYLSKDMQEKLQRMVYENSLKTKIDFDNDRNKMILFASAIANNAGANTETYLSTYGQEAVLPAQDLDESTAQALFALNELTQQFDGISARSLRTSRALPASLEYVAGLAESSGIAFTTPVSKFAVPFPYGGTLERLALQYLGDANRWHEIATLNGLSSPYVDETGWSLFMSTNGDRDKIYTDNIENIYINQSVYVVSNTIPRERRVVLSIQPVGTNYQLTLSGNPDLQKYTISDNAKIEGFLPNTVNSQKTIFIPSTVAIEDVGIYNSIPGINDYDPLIQAAGADLLLDENGDLIVTEDGDTRLAYGIQNIIQTIKASLEIERGSLLQHPEFGIGIRVGSSLSDLNLNEIKNTASKLFSGDPVFTGVQSVSAEQSGPYVKLVLVVGIKGLGSQIPITFNLKP